MKLRLGPASIIRIFFFSFSFFAPIGWQSLTNVKNLAHQTTFNYFPFSKIVLTFIMDEVAHMNSTVGLMDSVFRNGSDLRQE